MNLIKENKLIPDQDYTDDESIKNFIGDSRDTVRAVEWRKVYTKTFITFTSRFGQITQSSVV